MKHLYLKNVKNYNKLRIDKFLKVSNVSFFICYINYDELEILKKFLFENKLIFKFMFKFSFKRVSLFKNWYLWGTDFFVCFFFVNDFFFQIDFIIKNKDFISDFIYNGVFFNIDNIEKISQFVFYDSINELDYLIYNIIVYIHTLIYFVFNKILIYMNKCYI